MFAKPLNEFKEFTSGDGCRLREIFNPATNKDLKLGYSLAHAIVGRGEKSLPHRLDRSEVYYIISGSGIMHIDEETREVSPGVTVYIPPGSMQHIESSGDTDLEFVCMVDPGWTPDCEEIIS